MNAELVREEDLLALASHDKDEFIVEKVLWHRGDPRRRANLEFLIRWKGYDETEDTDRKSTRLNSSHITRSRMPSSA